jgi:hypothetical protein
VVHIVVAGYIVDHYCFMFDRGLLHIFVVGYIVDYYCLRLERGVVHIVVAVIVLTQYEPLFCQTSDISGQEYNQPQQYEPLVCQTLNTNGCLTGIVTILPNI